MKKIFVLLLVIGLSLKVYSQNHIKQDTLLRKSFEELSDLFYNSKPDTLKAYIYAKAKFRKALKEKDTLEMLNGKYLLADILNDENIYLDFCDSLINISKKTPTENFPAQVYIKRATFLFHKRRNSKALEDLIKANLIVNKQKNLYLKNKILYLMATIYNSIGQKKKALKLYKQVYDYALKQNLLTTDDSFSGILINLAIEYRNLNQIDSALLYNNRAVNLYNKINDSISLGYSYFSLGLIYQKKEKHQKAIEAYLKSIPAIRSDENFKILANIYSKIGLQYDSLSDEDNTLIYYLKADSIYSLTKIKTKNLDTAYKYLYTFYKNKDLRKQLIYLNKLLEIKEYNLSEKNKINKTLTEKYDIPNLLAEKKQVIEKLENEIQESRRNKIIYISLLVFSFVLISYQINKKRVYKKRFAALMKQNEATKTKEIEKIITQATSKQELSDDTVTTLMEGLEMFETHEDFLNSKINLQLLADRLDTNTSYLSKVINQYKNTSFSNYVNQLRIEYAVEKLKNDTLWRKYTVKAIA